MSSYVEWFKRQTVKAPAQTQTPEMQPQGRRIEGRVSFTEWFKRQGQPQDRGYVPMKDGASMAMNFFIQKGYTKHQAAGIVGNLIVESGNFDPNVISGKRRGDEGKAFGIAQWHPKRQVHFQKAFGRPIQDSNLTQQLEFIDWELNNTETKARDALRKARTAGEAADIFDRKYERSSGMHRQRRIQEAERLHGM